LLAKASCQSTSMYLTHRIREQARSHRVDSEIEKAPKGAFCLSGNGKLTLPGVAFLTQSDNVRLSIAAVMLGPQLHGRSL